ncbi:type II secretion system protein GspI [Rhodoferax lacus]|uniref:Type II secretion system protein I n=1 Tax=Rhodoferax lacus TaxID=2184758 RepID=A0A3E1RG86_9BURK|nr:type II secretion system minor pseudopilin GspI [Rhodoferax lacus]RFO97620.1 type II secretion system protein GspI [Rhodoferax lacus]
MSRQPRPGARAASQARGFTLIEVLVALGIVAIALTAGLKAVASLSRNAERQSDVMLAQMCAENELIKLRLARQLPGVGDSSSDCEQAGQTLQVQTTVRPTPNPNFLRVDAQVLKETTPVFQITTVMGRN